MSTILATGRPDIARRPSHIDAAARIGWLAPRCPAVRPRYGRPRHPVALLGLIKLVELRGAAWHAADTEIDDVLDRLGRG